MKNALFSLILFFTGKAFADVAFEINYQVAALSCPDKVQLLDFYEGEVIRHLQFSVDTDFQRSLENLYPYRPESVDLYKKDYDFFKDNKVISDKKPQKTLSSADSILKAPDGCEFVIVLEADFKNAIYVYKRIWERLSKKDQDGTILNWAMAKESHFLDQQSQLPTIYFRTLNALVAADQLKELSFIEFANLLKITGLNSIRKQGVLIDLLKDFAIENNQLQFAYPVKNSIWNYRDQNVRLKADRIVFHPNGSVKSLRFENVLKIQTLGGVVFFVTPDNFAKIGLDGDINPRIYFYPNGQVQKSLTLEKSSFISRIFDLKLSQYRGVWEAADSSHLYFFENGEVSNVSWVNGRFLF
jgi:hypothetical protein